jgi:ubiquinone/menaquinone biosynthesis C-methylase UbiE
VTRIAVQTDDMNPQDAPRASFARWARGYDDSALQPVLYHSVHRAVLGRIQAAMPDPGRLLDVGCGTGALLCAAARWYPGADLVGVDPCAPMITIAARSTPARFALASAEQLPFPDGTFDVVVATFTYRHWSDRAAGLAEIGRVLAPGGVLALAVIVPPAPAGWAARWYSRRPPPVPPRAALATAGLDAVDTSTVAGVGPISEVRLTIARCGVNRSAGEARRARWRGTGPGRGSP